jgi:hypothetical protein
MVSTMHSWRDWENVTALFPLWPLAWLDHVDLQTGLRIVCIYNLASTVVAAMLPHVRLARIAATLGLLWWSALVNSLSGVVSMHGLHLLIWVSAMLIFLPSGSVDEIARSRVRRTHYTRVFWLAQATVLSFYSSGGFFKIAAAAAQFMNGEVHAFMPEALARHVAFRLEEGNEVARYAFWGDWLVANPFWGILFLPMSIYLEAFSFLVAFRPMLHRTWAILLMMMHIGIATCMTIEFAVQCMMLGLLFFASPFAHEPIRLRVALRQLPLFGDLLRLVRPRQS